MYLLLILKWLLSIYHDYKEVSTNIKQLFSSTVFYMISLTKRIHSSFLDLLNQYISGGVK